MAKPPLPIGTWGAISSSVVREDDRGRPTKYEARALFHDFDGVTRLVSSWGGSKTAAENKLRAKLQKRKRLGGSPDLRHTDRVSVAAEIYFDEIEDLVAQEAMAPGSYQTYRYQYDKHLGPRLGQLRLFEATTPRVSDVIVKIRDEVGAATAKTCKSILSGTFALAVRHGALEVNPVREIRIRATGRRQPPRALSTADLGHWFELLRQDERAVRADLIDICKFMLATGERIGETLAVTWQDVNWDTGEVDCSYQVQRIKGQGLVRRRVKSAAGERILVLPDWTMDMLRARWTAAARPTSPVFPSTAGTFRDPTSVQKALRDVRRPIGGERRKELGGLVADMRRRARLTQAELVTRLGWPKTRISLIETARVRLDGADALVLADALGLVGRDRAKLLELAEIAGMRSLADELAWITSHAMRKTTATILESAGQTPRQIADQLGHADLSTIADYIGRKARNPEAALHLSEALREIHDQGRDTSPSPEI